MRKSIGTRLGAAAALMALAWGGPPGAKAADASLASVPFWAASAGWWMSDNTYFDGALNYNIRAYNSLTHIEIEGGRMRETEYKFYAPSKLAVGYGQGRVSAEEGIEVVTITVGEQAGPGGGLRYPPAKAGAPAARLDILGPADAVRVVPGPGAVDEYRMYISLPAPDRRYVVNYGIVSHPGDSHGAVGDLRGFSLFRATRVKGEDFARLRARLRAANKVAAVVTTGPDGAPVVQRLD